LVSTLSSTLVMNSGLLESGPAVQLGANVVVETRERRDRPEGAEAFKLVPKNNGVRTRQIMLLSTAKTS